VDSRQEQKVTTGKRASGSALEAMGHLHRLSSLVASGHFDEAVSAAVEIPLHCLGVSASALLLPSANPERLRLITSRNLTPDLQRDLITFHDEYLIDWVISNGTPKAVDDLAMLPSEASSPFLQHGIRAAACAPVDALGTSPGVMLCLSKFPRAFAVWEMELISLLANQVSAVFHQQDTASAPPSALPSKPAGDEEEAGDIVHRVLAEALSALSADGGSIMAKQGNRLRIIASQGLHKDAPRSSSLSDGTIAAWVATHGKPLMLNGRVQDERFAPAVERPEIVSAISIPLKSSRNLVGVLNVHSTQDRRRYTHRDLGTLARIAGRVALGIEYARLFDQSKVQTRYLRSLYRIARAITSTLDLDNVVQVIIKYMCEHLSPDVCALVMYDRAYDEIRLAGGYSALGGPDEQYLQLTRPAVRAVWRSKRPVEYQDLTELPEFSGLEVVRRLGLRSGVVAALAVKGNITGFVAAFRRQPGGFARQVVRVLPGLAELAAIAIENARLYQRQVDIAHLTQRSLVPMCLQSIPGFEIGYKYAPAYQVGGDYCDILKLRDGKYGIAIADVAGKDIKAASHIGMCRHSLRAVADEIKSPAGLMKKMNRCVCEQTEPEAFISMIYAVLDPATRKLTLSSAGHEPAVLFRKRSVCLEEISTYNLLLGILPHETYGQRRTSIQAGDILTLYTDGLVEALSSRETSGVDRLKSLLLDCHMQPTQEIADALHDQASNHTARNPDDIALILLKAL